MARASRSPLKDSLRDEIADIKREKILREAAQLFYEKGYLPSTVDAIAERFGATKPFVYYQFKNKIDLLIEICERGTREALAVTVKAVSEPLEPAQKLALFVNDFTMVVLETHKFVAIYFREQLNLPEEVAARIANMRKQIDSHVRTILTEGKAKGVFVFEDVAVASQVVTGTPSYAFAWYREPARLSKEQICAQMVTHVLRAVGVHDVGALERDGSGSSQAKAHQARGQR
jgi:AcrR family transcriptional regulator